MCFGIGNNIIINGHRVHSCFGGFLPPAPPFGAFSPGCFGYGFGCSANAFKVGAGIGLGYAAGMTLIPLVPAVIKGIGKGCSWLWNKAIVPAAKWIGHGIKNLWNKIF